MSYKNGEKITGHRAAHNKDPALQRPQYPSQLTPLKPATRPIRWLKRTGMGLIFLSSVSFG